MKKLWGSTAMITATIVWGVAFTAQSKAMNFVEPLPFTAMRSLIGTAALIAVTIILDCISGERPSLWGRAKSVGQRHFLLSGGIWCGLVISAASTCQQYGLKYISPGKTGFLTALYIIIVPLLGIFFKRKISAVMWTAVALGIAGAYLLCGGVDGIGKGELFVIISAALFSIHIMVIDHYAPECDCVRLSAIQFAVASLICTLASLFNRDPWIAENIKSALPYLLYCGIGSSAVAFTLQMVAQKYLHPVTATLLMSLESIFAVLGDWIFSGRVLSVREFIGCGIIFAAIILSQYKPGSPETVPEK